ncbi:hypothetical protein NDU88_000540 [Pleurodeles waltl]|uniref:Uncharacterized protein n=1 Tax=Pleurodeles waltl TaxID=8319 RepID=A0AAV7KMC7_PLEWA|nr:hypothetical protein NDU88_000540 [Pleurodeles waltl]
MSRLVTVGESGLRNTLLTAVVGLTAETRSARETQPAGAREQRVRAGVAKPTPAPAREEFNSTTENKRTGGTGRWQALVQRGAFEQQLGVGMSSRIGSHILRARPGGSLWQSTLNIHISLLKERP